MPKKASSTSRTRNYACIVYPESAPENWLDILREAFVPAFVSPLHDKDKNQSSEAEAKKPHFHVIIMFDSVKTREQAKTLIDSFGGVGCETINSIRGYARYLCHLDNPEKYQYSVNDVISLCGADYVSIIGLPTDRYTCITEMLDFCEQNDIVAYCDLLTYAKTYRSDWFRCLCDNSTVVMKEYLKSRHWKQMQQMQPPT